MTAERRNWTRGLHWDVLVGLIVIVLFLFGDAFTGVSGVRSDATAFFTLQSIAEVLIIALPMTMLIISGEIDLSVGSAVGLSSCVIGKAFDSGLPMWLCALLGITAGALGGALNGFLVTKVGLQSLAVTIGTLALYRGLAQALLGDKPVAGFPESWVTFGGYSNFFGWLPRVFLIVIPLVIVFAFLLHFAKTGHNVYAVGLSNEAARYSGIRVSRIKFGLFVATGTMAGLAGLLLTLRSATATPEAGIGVELSVIAAVLFGGVSIFGGVGTLVGAVNGVLFLGLARTVLRLDGIKPNVLTVVTGGLLLASVIAPALLARMRASSLFSRAAPAGRGSPSAQIPLADSQGR